MMSRLRRNAPAIVLFFLSPAIGELLSGSAPPNEFFSFFGLTVMAGLYGGGALLVREAVRRWRKGYLTMLCLGAAYGIFEEGIVCKSFFDPGWPDLGPLGSYGRWLGTNWVWAVWLTLYHAIISISVPILLVEVGFPGRRAEPWLSRGWQRGLLVVEGLVALFGYLVISKIQKFWVPLPHYLLTWAFIGFLIWLAPRLPNRLGQPGKASARPFWLWLTGFLWFPLAFACSGGLMKTGIPPIGTILLGLGLTAAAGLLILRFSGNAQSWNDRGRFLLAVGLLSSLALLAPLQELDKKRKDNPRGMSLVGAAAIALFVWQGRRVWRRTAPVISASE